jgi:hypothetical protein
MMTAKAITVSSVLNIKAVPLPAGLNSDHLDQVCSRGAGVAAIFISLRNVRQDKRPAGAPSGQSRALILLRGPKSCINSSRFKIKPAANV